MLIATKGVQSAPQRLPQKQAALFEAIANIFYVIELNVDKGSAHFTGMLQFLDFTNKCLATRV